MLPFFLLLFEKVHSGDAIFIIISIFFFFFKVQFQTKSSLSKTKEVAPSNDFLHRRYLKLL